MILVQYPPTLTRNINGQEDIVPSYLSELYLPDEDSDDIISAISRVSFNILKNNKYTQIQNFIVYDLGNDIASIHFQVPKFSIEQDGLEYDKQMISYYGVVRYGEIEGEIEDLIENL